MGDDGVEITIGLLHHDQTSSGDLRAFLDHKAALIRVNAIMAIGRKIKEDTSLIPDLVRAANDPRNDVKLIGTITVSHVAIESLLRSGSREASQRAQEIVESRSEQEREDIRWYLRSQGITLPGVCLDGQLGG